jgi:protein-tyrosine phosphatase
MAEGIFKEVIKGKGLHTKISCDSAGTSAYHIGEDPDHRMMETALKHGIKLSHKGRQLNIKDFSEFDYIIAMDKTNLEDIKSLSLTQNKPHDRILLMRDFDLSDENLNVPDPYWSKLDGFEEVYQILYRCNSRFLEYILDEQKLTT